MDNIAIKGIYSTKKILDTAELADAEAGDAYMVGTKVPYDLYIYSGKAFVKKGTITNETNETKTEIDLSELLNVSFKSGERSYKLRRAFGRGLKQDLYELYGVK